MLPQPLFGSITDIDQVLHHLAHAKGPNDRGKIVLRDGTHYYVQKATKSDKILSLDALMKTFVEYKKWGGYFPKALKSRLDNINILLSQKEDAFKKHWPITRFFINLIWHTGDQIKQERAVYNSLRTKVDQDYDFVYGECINPDEEIPTYIFDWSTGKLTLANPKEGSEPQPPEEPRNIV